MILPPPTSYLRNGMARNAIFVYTLPAISKTTLSGSNLLKIKGAAVKKFARSLIFNITLGPFRMTHTNDGVEQGS